MDLRYTEPALSPKRQRRERPLESDPTFRQYRERRTKMYERLDEIREQVTEWLARHAEQWPGLTDLARLEALHSERAQLLADFQETDDAFIDYVLKRRSD